MAEAKDYDGKMVCCGNSSYFAAKGRDAMCSSDVLCKGCGGEQCSRCKATALFNDCVAKATNYDGKMVCCGSSSYIAAKGRDTMCSSDVLCKGCGGEQCSRCKATALFNDCVAKANNYDG